MWYLVSQSEEAVGLLRSRTGTVVTSEASVDQVTGQLRFR